MYLGKEVKTQYEIKTDALDKKMEIMQNEQFAKMQHYDGSIKNLTKDYHEQLKTLRAQLKKEALQEARDQAREEVNKYMKTQALQSQNELQSGNNDIIISNIK